MANYLTKLIASILGVDMTEVVRMAERLEDAWKADASVWIVGNGGSASTAAHFANDLVKMAGVRAFAVADMTPVVMAYGNDEGWENMFAAYLERVLLPNDVIVAISCSGNSPNVVKAVELFEPSNIIVLTGMNAESWLGRNESAVKVFVGDDNIRVQEDVHLIVCHMVAGMVAERTRG